MCRERKWPCFDTAAGIEEEGLIAAAAGATRKKGKEQMLDRNNKCRVATEMKEG